MGVLITFTPETVVATKAGSCPNFSFPVRVGTERKVSEVFIFPLRQQLDFINYSDN